MSTLLGLISTLAGAGLIVLAVVDVHATVFHPRLRNGPLSECTCRTVWRIARRLAWLLPRQQRHRVLNAVGPLLMPSLPVLIVVTLTVGFSLVYLPHFPGSFHTDPAPSGPPWLSVLYFSGVSLLTIGYGDVTPATPAMRLLALLEAGAGFAIISLTVTYLLSAYSAMERTRVVALSVYHQAEEGADVARFVTYHWVNGQFLGLDDVLHDAARDLQAQAEAYVEHPIISYFHPAQVHKGLPRLLFLTLESSALLYSGLDAGRYPEIARHPHLRTLRSTARHLLTLVCDSLHVPAAEAASARFSGEERRVERWVEMCEELRAAGIAVAADAAASLAAYQQDRSEWEPALQRLAGYLGYDWDEVAGDRDLHYAADEGKQAPDDGRVT